MRSLGLFGFIALGLLFTPVAAEEKAKLDPEKLVGTWAYVSGEKDGKKVAEDELKKGEVEISKENIILKAPDGKFVIKYELDTSKTPCRIKLEIKEGPQGQGSKAEGIIAVDGDVLKLCYPPMGGDVPKEFSGKEGSRQHLFVLKRKK
jgi:uncharacterized protein (TIGR03067 family)